MPLSVCVFCLCAPHDLVVPRAPLCPYLVFLFSLSPYLVSSVRVYLITSFTFCYLNPVFSTVQRPVLTSMLCFCVSLPVLCYPVLRRRKTVPLRFTLCLLAPHFNTVCNCDISHINVSFPLPALLSTVDVRDGSAQFVLLYTFLRIFTFSFYMHNVCTIYIRQKNTFGHWTPLH